MNYFKLAPIAGLLMASSAFAAEPVADIKIYAAGASAQLNTISGILTSLCVPNSGTTPGVNQIQYFHGYGNSTGASSTSVNGNLRGFRCTLATNAAEPTLSGKIILFAYSAIDGSGSGVKFVAAQANRKFINWDACPTSPLATQSVASSVTPTGSAQYNCNGLGAGATSTVTTQDRAPSVGSSDVEPALFTGPNAVPGLGDVSSSDIDALTVRPGRAVIFGVYGNKALWLELQKRQGIVGASATAPIMPFTTTVNPANNALTNVVNPAFDESKRPNITKVEYRSIVQGTVSDLKTVNGTFSPVSGTSLPVPFQLARRVNGSGTQAMSNVYFLNNSCGTPVGASLTPAAAYFDPTDPTGYQVTEGSGTGNVITELQSKLFPVIGVISLENPSRGDYTLTSAGGNTDLAAKGAFAALKLEGVTPNRANTINGSYEFFGEETIQWNKTIITAGSLSEKFMNRFVAAAASISTLSSLNAATQEGSAALSAYNGLPSTNTTWIMNSSRDGNNCAPATKIIE
jgi:hypothetical protein